MNDCLRGAHGPHTSPRDPKSKPAVALSARPLEEGGSECEHSTHAQERARGAFTASAPMEEPNSMCESPPLAELKPRPLEPNSFVAH